MMLRRSRLCFSAAAASLWWDISFEDSFLPVSQDEYDLQQPMLCHGQMEATFHSFHLGQGPSGLHSALFFVQSLLAFWGLILEHYPPRP